MEESPFHFSSYATLSDLMSLPRRFAPMRLPLQEAGEEVALRVLERAVIAAGGSGERVPLAKLEAVLAGIRAARAAGPGRWTLARALIAAEPSIVRVEREPGREPLPEIAVSPGATVLWDGRFRVTVAAGFPGGPVQVRPLGEAGLRELRRRAPDAENAPARAAAAVPSIWHEGRLIAVPPLRYWAPPLASGDVGAVFVGIASSAGRSIQAMPATAGAGAEGVLPRGCADATHPAKPVTSRLAAPVKKLLRLRGLQGAPLQVAAANHESGAAARSQTWQRPCTHLC